MKLKVKSLEYGVFPLILGILVCVMTASSVISLGQGCRFYLYQIFCVLLPGMVIYRLLRIPGGADVMERNFCGYALGFIAGIVQYFIFAIVNALEFLPVFQFLVAAVSIFIFLRYFELEETFDQKMSSGKEWILFTVFVFLVFAIRYVTYFERNMLPSAERDTIFPTQDILFYIGNAISAKKGFPLEEFRFVGRTFKYHYFGSVELAVASMVTGISALELELCLGWLQPMLLMVSSLYLLLRRMEVNWILRILGMVVLLFTAGQESLVYVDYQRILYGTPFGYDFGLAMGIFVVFFLYIQFNEQKLGVGTFVGTLAAFFACEGSKAPIAVVLLFFAGCVCGIWLLTPKKRMWAFVYGLPLVALFVAVFFGIVSEGLAAVTTNVTGLKFDLTGRLHLYESGLGKMYFDWTAQGMPGVMGKILILGMFYFGCNAVAYFLLLVLSGKFFWKKKSNFLTFESSMLAAVCFGLLMTLVTKQQGNSQMYFAMFSFPLAVVLSMRLWTELAENFGKWSGRMFCSCFAVLLIYSIVNFVQVIAPFWKEGEIKLAGGDVFDHRNNSLTYGEWLAYQWVKNNTEDAVCITNVILDDSQYESFVVGVCTERQMYMEGWRYVAGYINEEIIQQRREIVRAFFEGNDIAGREIRAAGVRYVIWVKRYDYVLSGEITSLGENVYENDAVIVYAVWE